MLQTGDKVKIAKIINQFKADHLINLIDKTGIIVAWIVDTNDVKKYKIKIDGTEDTYYFIESELERIE